MHFTVSSAIKEFLNKRGMMAAADLAEGLSASVQELLEKGMKRAQENGRKTVRPCDL